MSTASRAYTRRCIDAAVEREGIMPATPARRHIRLHAPSVVAVASLIVWAGVLYAALIASTL